MRKASVCGSKVADQGPGVAPELLPRIFDRLVTSHSRNGGLGLGLFLARQIALAHGGDLTIESVLGKGARFRLTLPCTPPSSEPALRPTA